jgi:CSLREA domain-containing protein
VAWLVAGVLAATPLLGLPASVGAGGGQTFTVNRTADTDDGQCSIFIPSISDCTLREAINAANDNNNAPAVDTIAFDISGAGPHTIAPTSQLPEITEPVTIDGFTQDDAVANSNATGAINASPQIVLNGANAGQADGLDLTAGASGSVIKGLVVNGFQRLAFRLSFVDDAKIEGNFLGVDAAGTNGVANGTGGIQVNESQRVTIGGLAPAQRNLISANDGDGVFLNDSPQAAVQGNLIGTAKNGTSDRGNGDDGVRLLGSKNSTIGGSEPAAANVIAFNDGIGVAVADNLATGVRIVRNSFLLNGQLPIDLKEDGPTANDNKDLDGGPNRRQNFPKLTLAKTANGQTTIKGTLNSTPNTKFTVEIFVSPVGFGDVEGTTFVVSKVVKTNDKGKANFSVVVNPPLAVGDAVTATATDNKRGDTSEFSEDEVVVAG